MRAEKKAEGKKVVIYGEENFRTVAGAKTGQRIIGNILESLRRRAMERGYDTVYLSSFAQLGHNPLSSIGFHFKVSFSRGGFSKDVAHITKDGIEPTTSIGYCRVRKASLAEFDNEPVDLGAKKERPMEKYALL